MYKKNYITETCEHRNCEKILIHSAPYNYYFMEERNLRGSLSIYSLFFLSHSINSPLLPYCKKVPGNNAQQALLHAAKGSITSTK